MSLTQCSPKLSDKNLEHFNALPDPKSKELESLTNVLQPADVQIKVYNKRWIILLLFVSYATVNYVQWTQYTIIENIMTRYYKVSPLAIEWTAIVSSVLYGTLLLPITYMIHKLDLRMTCIIAAVSTSIGSWIKVFSVSRDGFVIAFIGQVFVAAYQIVATCLPASLAAYWFGPEEVATAIATCNLGSSIGTMLSMYVIPKVVRNHANLETVGHELYTLVTVIAVCSTVVTIGMIFFFQNEPKLPPSKSRAMQKLLQSQEFEFLRPLGRVLVNKNFVLLLNAHGLICGILNAIITLLNPLYFAHFETGEERVGGIGMTVMVVGTIGYSILGRIQDRFKMFKETLIILNFGSVLGEVLFAVALYMESVEAVYVSSAILGFCMLSFYMAGFEICAEITYPESEGVCAAILIAAGEIYGVILVIILNTLILNYGDLEVHVFITVLLIISFVLTVCVHDERKRQEAMKISD